VKGIGSRPLSNEGSHETAGGGCLAFDPGSTERYTVRPAAFLKGRKMTVFLVSYYKFKGPGEGFGFRRMHFQFFATTLDRAKEMAQQYFCDEAGWYEGAYFEEHKEGDPYWFKGHREFMRMEPGGKLVTIPLPEEFKNVVKLT
jgi:hypothetical protein